MENLSRETETILNKAAMEMLARSSQPVHFEMPLSAAVGLIGNLQLAFRRPANVGRARQEAEAFVRDLIERIDPTRGSLYRVLMMGFDSDFDV